MKTFVAGRQLGKTTRAIEWAAENGSHIVCHSKDEATRIFHLAKKMGKDVRFPITYDELREHLGAGVRSLVFENVDLYLAHLARGKRVVGFTATSEA